jgi:uncharacterized protein YvpB
MSPLNTALVRSAISSNGSLVACIAFLNTLHLSYWNEATSHAAIVVGIDEQHVYLNDPFFDTAPQRVSRLEFELAWDDMDNTYAIITL